MPVERATIVVNYDIIRLYDDLAEKLPLMFPDRKVRKVHLTANLIPPGQSFFETLCNFYKVVSPFFFW